MLTSYDRDSDWAMEECSNGLPPGGCPNDELRKLSFPQALIKALEGYPLPKGAKP
jgi:hypothetical protein